MNFKKGFFLIALWLLTGCSLNTVKADNCAPAADGEGDACSFNNHIKEKDQEVFYCQGETHFFPKTKTYSFHLEVGVSQLVSDPNLSGCTIPLPDKIKILNMRGTIGVKPFTSSLVSASTWLYSVDEGHKAVLHTAKLTTEDKNSINLTLESSTHIPIVFINGHNASKLLFWFDLDLKNSVPTTFNIAGSGETE